MLLQELLTPKVCLIRLRVLVNVANVAEVSANSLGEIASTCKDKNFYCKLARRIKDTNFNHLLNYGMKGSSIFPRWFVIYFYDLKGLHPYFKDQFEVIPLETEKQEETVEITTNQKKTTNIIPFLTPPGAKWSDLKMTIIGYDKTVKIEVKGGRPITTNYKKMGFEDSRKGEPDNAWKRLIGFAYNKGMLTRFSSTEKSKIEKDVQGIRNTLSERFKINGKPIPDYINGEGYKTAFEIFYRDAREQKSKELSNFKDNKDDIDSRLVKSAIFLVNFNR